MDLLSLSPEELEVKVNPVPVKVKPLNKPRLGSLVKWDAWEPDPKKPKMAKGTYELKDLEEDCMRTWMVFNAEDTVYRYQLPIAVEFYLKWDRKNPNKQIVAKVWPFDAFPRGALRR